MCFRVGQQDVDIKLSGHFIKEIHCVFVSETNEQGEGETHTHTHIHLSVFLFFVIYLTIFAHTHMYKKDGKKDKRIIVQVRSQ